jgi:hypothetical protein
MTDRASPIKVSALDLRYVKEVFDHKDIFNNNQ